MIAERTPRPRAATYRVQLHAGFTFDGAAAVAGYLADLGVSHLYCSPYLQAARGSTHGYDVVDHSRLNSELGGEAGHDRLVRRLAEAGLRQVLDIVPNHMAVGGRANRWWWDVLANGPDSRYADYFDIDWDPPQPELAGLVLVPVLGDHYGRVLEAGELTVAERDGELYVRYYEHELPLSRHAVAELVRRYGEISQQDIDSLNRDHGALDTLLRRQNYRLACWRTAAEQLNYRRFFDITSLAGLRVEDPQVFADSHLLILRLVKSGGSGGGGTLDGLRIDHVDGLADPEGYLRRLAAETGGGYVVVEKILEAGEELPASWPVAGTSGYDFLNAVNQLYTDSAGESAMRACYTEFTGEPGDYAGVVYAAKLEVMRHSLAAELTRLTGLLARVCEGHRRVRDVTRRQLEDLLTEVLAGFGVYRVYCRPSESAGPGRPATDADREHVAAAVAAARRRRPGVDAELASFLAELLCGQHPGGPETEFTVHFAQVSAPVIAKGVEDTAFYRYHVLTSLCEVGGDPGTFGRPVGDFHRAMAATAERWPETMLTLSTHDTKRSADVRARLALLAELPGAWQAAVRRWAAQNERHKRAGWPDRNTEYLLYQTLVGAWPLDGERVRRFMAKAVREAKVHTSWTDPDPGYDEAVDAFVTAVLTDQVFVADLERFLAEHQLIERGRISSLAQMTLLLTCPGVPDIYQGTEVWDLSLVDPDNRRPVDFTARERLLADLAGAGPEEALAAMARGGPKLWLIHRVLWHRLRHPEPFGPGSGYEPLSVSGTAADHVVAFTRTAPPAGAPGQARAPGLTVVVPRLLAGLGGGPWGQGAWADTTVTLPDGAWTDMLTGGQVTGGPVELETLLRNFPVAVLAPQQDGGFGL
ncbi:MAG TPA: malto-oligosyltrehalose synthase [Streptosporangiaceae bacterium]|jgi:(1->4)-alpha-D-glucan 1-alpha-D-glucosylmutase